MGRMKKEIIGRRRYGSLVDATDPCYKRDVWCRMNDIPLVPGEYTCAVWLSNEGEWGTRVGIIGIYFGGAIPTQKELVEIGHIGVDAGLAGFFENKPDYTDEQWSNFCDFIRNPEEYAWIIPEGFFSSSGYGDGGYSVYARKLDDGRATALEIRFL